MDELKTESLLAEGLNSRNKWICHVDRVQRHRLPILMMKYTGLLEEVRRTSVEQATGYQTTDVGTGQLTAQILVSVIIMINDKLNTFFRDNIYGNIDFPVNQLVDLSVNLK